MQLKRKDLEIFLQQLDSMSRLKIKYEQYPTPARVAANLLWEAGIENNDFFEKTVLDLGCGTGILTIGAAYLGARNVFGIDIDIQALEIAKKNSKEMDYTDICYWICSDIKFLELKGIQTTIMNPPFGMRKESKSRDRDFIKKALEISDTVYSINPHNEKTRSFFKKFCKNFGAEIDKIILMDFDISRFYSFHKKDKHIFQVDLYRIIK